MHILETKDVIKIVDLQKLNTAKNLSVRKLSVRDFLLDANLAKPTTFNKLKVIWFLSVLNLFSTNFCGKLICFFFSQRMNPLSAQPFYYEDLNIMKYTSVKVLYVESPHCIYVQKVMSEVKLLFTFDLCRIHSST